MPKGVYDHYKLRGHSLTEAHKKLIGLRMIGNRNGFGRSGGGGVTRGKEERGVVERIKSQYDDIFSPNAICDRIAFKGDSVFFIEIKRDGQKLTLRQTKFRRAVKEVYSIEIV